ncbi:hypothetical protein FRC09_001302 [Ceratobasidium sp. 395]|nr:hypothetical protein FRC09_001302 [Ceratobasidium sp. 395]
MQLVLHILPNNHTQPNPRTKPFQRWISLDNNAEMMEARGTVDAGSQANVLDVTLWAANQVSLGPLLPSRTLLRVADGKASRCIGKWRGWVEMDGVQIVAEFEVFDSGGAFEVLLGKPWLTSVKAEQRFGDDSLKLKGLTEPLPNGYPLKERTTQPAYMREMEVEREAKEETKEEVKEEVKEWMEEAKEEEREEVASEERVEATKEEGREREEKEETTRVEEQSEEEEDGKGRAAPRRSRRLRNKRANKKPGPSKNMFFVNNAQLKELEEMMGMERGREGEMNERDGASEGISREASDELEEARQRAVRTKERREKVPKRREEKEEIFETLQTDIDRSAHIPKPPSPRTTDPFSPKRVADILSKVTIGPDLTEDERSQVKALIAEFADVFALDLSKVLPVKTHHHRLNIPAGTKFRQRVNQKPLSQAQKEWLYPQLDQMEAAGIIKRVPNTFPAAVSPTNVVPKPGGTNEPSLEYLQAMANQACRDAGIPIRYPEPQSQPAPPPPKEAKFRLVHNFCEVNDHTKIPAFPMGDLAAKQRSVAGFRYVNVIDFASGFNALPMEEESIKYTGFYVEGKGHYVYLRMPFGLTGAPTSFCEMLADAIHDLLGDGTEVWMDDVGMGFNLFSTGMDRTRRLLLRCRERGLSLAPAKANFFMSEAGFAGAKVSVKGVQPDRRKVQAILEWPEPKSVLELMGFLGLTGAFRSKIKDYARIAQPLSDLTRNIKIERRADGKLCRGEYKRALQNAPVNLTDEARQAFMELKLALTSDPILRAPVYDGRPFILTTDGSKYGFGAMLTQRWETTDPKTGKTKSVSYPVAFASKRTSRTEENYAPFLIEFAALKFAFDSVEQIVMGQSVELETDCKALADLLGNKKLTSPHERWRESIIAHRITAVRHRPGVENPVCNALSRKWQYREEDEGEGRDETVDPSWEAHKGLLEEVSLLVDDESSKKAVMTLTKVRLGERE